LEVPWADFLFAFEVIARKYNRTLLISGISSMLAAYVFVHYFDSDPLFSFAVKKWRWQAMPFAVILGLIGGIFALYFTKIVIYAKTFFGGISNNFIRVNLGAVSVGVFIFFSRFCTGTVITDLEKFLKTAYTTQ
jgi:CIC family chloride channel protein